MQTVTYQQQVEQWRAVKEDELRRENSWLALAGLFWLKEGVNTMGSHPQADIVLPKGAAQVGTITLDNHALTLTAADPAVGLRVEGESVTTITLHPDMSDRPTTYVTMGELTFMIIQRGDSYALRLWDNGRVERQSYPGRKWYPIDANYAVQGHYNRYEQQEMVQFERTLGDAVAMQAAGVVAFELLGQSLQLTALENVPNRLFLLFRDQTTGRGTYPAGRYLYADVQDDGTALLDFNQAFSPPCAVTTFATCLYPPRENHLSVCIEAGELYEPFP